MFWTTLNNKIMRKLFVILTLSVAFAGCDKQPNDNGALDVSLNEPTRTSIRVSVDETRAAGVDSAEGVFVNGVLGSDNDNVTMRYIMQIYMDDVAVTKYVTYSDEPNVEFTPELIPNRDYRFVVWADVVTEGKKDIDNHYNTKNPESLENITLKGEWNAMDESRDAFTGFTIKENFTGGNVNISLTRPFAKLRIVATDKAEALATPVKGLITYTSSHRAAFNAKTGKAAAATVADKVHEYTIMSYTADTEESYTLFTDYFFAVDDKISLTFAFYEEGVSYPIMNKRYIAENVSVMSNRITTIRGNILTGDEKINFGESNISVTEWGNGGEVLIPGIVPGI